MNQLKLMHRKLNNLFLENQQDAFFIFYPEKIKRILEYFSKEFIGTVIYAVKANPADCVLEQVIKNGIRSFDVASLKEVRLIRKKLSDSEIYFMNTVKSRSSIRESYFKYNVRNFSIDSIDELKKIIEETNSANDLVIYLRVSVPNDFSTVNLSSKFGINHKDAPKLLNQIKNYTKEIGLTFHVGSQCVNPHAFKVGIKIMKKVIQNSKVKIKFLNVGGGFPSSYPGFENFLLSDYFNQIKDEFSKLSKFNLCRQNLFSEPGRSIVGDCMSLVTQVNLRKKNKLFLNDGIHGPLNNAGYLNLRHPVRLFNRVDKSSRLKPFSFYGPTCDSRDYIKGPFYLPSSIDEGDWIEILSMGAYSLTMQNDFNGFFKKPKIFNIDDL